MQKKFTFAAPDFRKSGIPEVSLKRRESLQNPTKNMVEKNEDRDISKQKISLHI